MKNKSIATFNIPLNKETFEALTSLKRKLCLSYSTIDSQTPPTVTPPAESAVPAKVEVTLMPTTENAGSLLDKL